MDRPELPDRNPWLPLALKLLGVSALLGGLAAIGAASMVLGQGGVAVARGAAPGAESAWAVEEPRREAPAASGRARSDERSPRPSPGVTPDGKVILNLADVDDLRRLPGVGKRRAEAILELRARLKRFRRVNELLRVRGLGVRGLRRIAPRVVLDPPAPPAGADAGTGSADAGERD